MNDRERALIGTLLGPMFPGRDELLEQMRTAKVRRVDQDGSLELLIISDIKASHVRYVVPTEGEYRDPDGVTVHVLLHVVGDQAKELEFFREDNGRVQTWPDPATVRVFAPE
jgi:hypothetical protein